MALTGSHLKVTYHFEKSGKKSSPDYQEQMISAPDYNSIKTVLANNGKSVVGDGTLVVSGYLNVGPAGNILT